MTNQRIANLRAARWRSTAAKVNARPVIFFLRAMCVHRRRWRGTKTGCAVCAVGRRTDHVCMRGAARLCVFLRGRVGRAAACNERKAFAK
ncbi:hypothetical protein [Massilia sp. TSP1-1-2]|uniref:hypothetical protein n=1 Tax=Massilia sp. TSP1-1-2 TaxID=2804649 RepID=UPI003CF27D0B